MTFEEYQKLAKDTAIYKRIAGIEYIYPVLGLAGESGEVVEKVKKMFRGDKAPSDEVRAELTKELGDVLWYISQIATELNISLETIASDNIKKLKDREKRSILHASGDNR